MKGPSQAIQYGAVLRFCGLDRYQLNMQKHEVHRWVCLFTFQIMSAKMYYIKWQKHLGTIDIFYTAAFWLEVKLASKTMLVGRHRATDDHDYVNILCNN